MGKMIEFCIILCVNKVWVVEGYICNIRIYVILEKDLIKFWFYVEMGESLFSKIRIIKI